LRRLRLSLLAPAVAVVALTIAGGASLASAFGAAPKGGSSPGSAAPTDPRVRVIQPPVGLSIEYPLMAQELGSAPCPPSTLVNELIRLGAPPLHLGGNSQDLTVPAGVLPVPSPSWTSSTLYQLPATFWAQLHCLLTATKEPLTVGLNLKSSQLPWDALMVAQAQAAATSGLAFSLGNEPDLYYLPNYASLGKGTPNAEALGVNLYVQLGAYLRQAVGTAPLVGPELAHPHDWRRLLPRVIAELHMATVGVHLYPLSDCGSPSAVTLSRLLSVESADAPNELAWVVSDANAAGVPAIISEANSAACGGKAGVSDSPASAVWAIRYVLTALKIGFQEVRFHMSGGPYDPYIVQGSHVSERPLAIALTALNYWLPVGSSLATLSTSHGVVATSVTGGHVELIYDNERTKTQTLMLPATHDLRVEVMSSVHAGLAKQVLPVRHGKVKLRIAPNSLVAVLS